MAATVMLDTKHSEFQTPVNDSNLYTFGCIGAHNIAIGCLSEGDIGNNSAAIVAIRMTSIFSSLKF